MRFVIRCACRLMVVVFFYVCESITKLVPFSQVISYYATLTVSKTLPQLIRYLYIVLCNARLETAFHSS